MATTLVGADGTILGITALDEIDVSEVPLELVAMTVKVYDVPLVNPVTIIGLTLPIAMIFPGVEVTVYEVAPVDPVKDTVA